MNLACCTSCTSTAPERPSASRQSDPFSDPVKTSAAILADHEFETRLTAGPPGPEVAIAFPANPVMIGGVIGVVLRMRQPVLKGAKLWMFLIFAVLSLHQVSFSLR